MAIPYIQKEVDIWTNQHNMTPRRANKKKVLPHGAPILIQERPQDYATADFKVCLHAMLAYSIEQTLNHTLQVNVSADMFDQIEADICPKVNSVFALVPPLFEAHITAHYAALDEPDGRCGVHLMNGA